MRNCRPPDGLWYHSDRGSQYCRDEDLAVLEAHGVVRSMSRNALILCAPFPFLDGNHRLVLEYRDFYYNPQRRPATPSFLGQMDYEQRTPMRPQ